MSYEPSSPTQQDRSRNYALMWFGGACTLLVSANLFVGMDNMLVVMTYGGMAGGLIQASLGKAHDEYFRELAAIGWRFLGTGLGCYLMILFLIAAGDFSYSAGYWASASDTPSAHPFAQNRFFADPITVGVSLSALFYAGFAFGWLRDNLGARS